MYLNELYVRPADHKYSSSEIFKILSNHFNNPATSDFLESRIENSGISQRAFCEPLENLVALKGLKERAEIFHKNSKQLLTSIVTENNFSYEPEVLISSCCSLPALPAQDIELLSLLNITSSPFRVPSYQQGCLGGVWSLALARKMHSEKILLCSYELCSLLFQNKNISAAQLMGAILFADGLSLATIEKTATNPLLKIISSKDLIIKNSNNLLGYSILDDTTELVLSPQIPDILARELPKFVGQFLAENNLQMSQIKKVLSHPGGLKILNGVKTSLNIDIALLDSSYSILSEFGNMSSTSIFFVINEFLKQKDYHSGDYVLILGVGPGINLELVLCQIP